MQMVTDHMCSKYDLLFVVCDINFRENFRKFKLNILKQMDT